MHPEIAKHKGGGWEFFSSWEKKKEKKKNQQLQLHCIFLLEKLTASLERIDQLPSHHTDCLEQVSTGSAELTHTFARGQFISLSCTCSVLATTGCENIAQNLPKLAHANALLAVEWRKNISSAYLRRKKPALRFNSRKKSEWAKKIIK